MSFVSLAQAIALLEKEEVVALPTETVYGLAARVCSRAALLKVFSTKSRPFFDPLIVHVLDRQQAQTVVSKWPDLYDHLVEKYWPGPLTLVTTKSSSVDDLVTSGLRSVALRSPQHEMFQRVLQRVGPLAAPSANRFGRVSPTQAQHVLDEFSGRVAVVDGGPCRVGIESTIVQFDEVLGVLNILRPGQVTERELGRSIGVSGLKEVKFSVSNAVPGHLPHHYEPEIPLAIIKGDGTSNLEEVQKSLGLAELRPAYLHLPRAPELAARSLYSELRRLAEPAQFNLILFQVDSWHEEVAWRGVMDRISRAARYKDLA